MNIHQEFFKGFCNKAERYISLSSGPRSSFLPTSHFTFSNPTLSISGAYTFSSCSPTQKKWSSQRQNPRPQHSIYIKYQEMQQLRRDPVAQNMHRVNNIESVIEERQPLRDAHVQRHHPSRCDKVVERSVQIHGGRDDSYVLSLILTANVATPPPMSRPIRIVPGFLTARTSSMVKSRLEPLAPSLAQRFFSRPFRSKQSLQSSKPFWLRLRHEAAELVGEVGARAADRGKDLVRVEVLVEPQWEFLWRCEGNELRREVDGGGIGSRVLVLVLRGLWLSGGYGSGGVPVAVCSWDLREQGE
ncbi:hypothetical protein Sango_0980900 [Sesamum angolense]|uniref:Uncharacterized protein n=1 Tax=Sesamum angolense TaxID=2727404 RepID=A0AAE1X067_9LAMI|nr:hypothetical protein Sango_0980900 [Sesamum angolense]